MLSGALAAASSERVSGSVIHLLRFTAWKTLFQVPAADLLGPSSGSEPADQTRLFYAGRRCESPVAVSHLRWSPAHSGRLQLRSARALVGKSCDFWEEILTTHCPVPVDQEFDTVSSFLLNRTKDMVNKYRQLLVREAQVRTPPPPRVRVPAAVF